MGPDDQDGGVLSVILVWMFFSNVLLLEQSLSLASLLSPLSSRLFKGAPNGVRIFNYKIKY